jgi:hypothetical protein
MYHSSTYALLLNANLNVGHPVNVDCCALKADSLLGLFLIAMTCWLYPRMVFALPRLHNEE